MRIVLLIIILMLSATAFAAFSSSPNFEVEGDELQFTNYDYIYDQVYLWNGVEWQSRTCVGPQLGNGWLSSCTLDISAERATLLPGTYSLAGYACNQEGNVFDCNGGNWLLTTFTVDPPVSNSYPPSSSSWQTFDAQVPGDLSAITFSATPSANNADALTMFSDIAGTSVSNYAILVRFASDGFIDARDGNSYSRDQNVAYQAGQSYDFEVLVDLINNKYSVFVQPQGGSKVAVAQDFDFRSDRSNPSTIAHMGLVAYSGSHTVSNLQLQLQDPPACDGNLDLGEVCDGNARSCTTSNGYTGSQQCNNQCTGFGTCTTTLRCGDGRVDGNEQCEGGSKACITASGYPGTQACSSCQYGSCTTTLRCGDGRVDGPEDCDDGPGGNCPDNCQQSGSNNGDVFSPNVNWPIRKDGRAGTTISDERETYTDDSDRRCRVTRLTFDGPQGVIHTMSDRSSEATAWSPDSKYITYQRRNSGYSGSRREGIYKMNVETGVATLLVEGRGAPVFSRDGREIYFITTRNNERTLRAVNVNTYNQRILRTFTDSYRYVGGPEINSDGSLLTVGPRYDKGTSDTSDDESQVLIVNSETGEFYHRDWSEDTRYNALGSDSERQFSPIDPKVICATRGTGRWGARAWDLEENNGRTSRELAKCLADHSSWHPGGTYMMADGSMYNLDTDEIEYPDEVISSAKQRGLTHPFFNPTDGDRGFDARIVLESRESDWPYVYMWTIQELLDNNGNIRDASKVIANHWGTLTRNPQHTHSHFSPDGRWVVFQSDMFGSGKGDVPVGDMASDSTNSGDLFLVDIDSCRD